MAHEATVTLAVQYLRLMADQLDAAGASVDDWLAANGLSRGVLHDPSVELGHADLQGLLLDAAELVGEPAVGLVLGQQLAPNTHGALGYAIMNSGSLRTVLALTRRFIRLRVGFLSLDYTVEPDALRVAIVEALPLGPIRHLVLEAVTSAVKLSIDAVSMGVCPVRRVVFPFEDPGYADLARELLGCEVLYGGARAELLLSPDVLDRPLRLADPEALRVAEALCQRELEKLASSRTASAAVRRLLLERRHGFPSLTTTARLLRTTPRTLHRRLLSEGTSYRAIVDELRYRSARDHLEGGRISVEAIAYVLGYANAANFRRAFKRWAGVSPSAWRAARQVTERGRDVGQGVLLSSTERTSPSRLRMPASRPFCSASSTLAPRRSAR